MVSKLLGKLARVWDGKNRRRWKRHTHVTYIEIQPLDNDMVVLAPAVWGMTRDFSKRGIGLVTSFHLNCVYVRVTIPSSAFVGLGIVRHQRIMTSSPDATEFFVGIEMVDEKDVIV